MFEPRKIWNRHEIKEKAKNEKVESGNVAERRCHRLKASFAGKFLKCIRELIR